jgi:hypothetical protein
MLKCSALICLNQSMNNNVEHRSLGRRGVPSIRISNCAPVIPVDPAPDATALGARKLEQDRGSQSTTAPGRWMK